MWLTPKRKIGLRQSLIWAGIVVLMIAFKTTYFYNSHGVYSDYIGYIWLPPLILLSIYFIFSFLLQVDFGEWGRFGINAGVGTTMVYQAIKGIYEIARVEPENSIDARWAPIFLIIGIVMFGIGVIFSSFHIARASKEKTDEQEKETL